MNNHSVPNKLPCPEEGTIDVLIASKLDLQVIAVLIVCGKDDLVIEKLKDQFQSKGEIFSAMSKISNNLQNYGYLNHNTANLVESMTMLHNAASESKARTLLKDENKRNILVTVLDNLAETIEHIEQIKNEHLQHCRD